MSCMLSFPFFLLFFFFLHYVIQTIFRYLNILMDISINSVKSQHYVVYINLMLPGVLGLFVCFKSLGEMWQGHC